MSSRVAAASSLLDYRKIMYMLLSLAAGWLAVAASCATVRAAEARTLVVPAEDGYGVASDCLATDKACGHMVADAWCQANGMSAALAYGRADDVTGALAGAKPAAVDPTAYIVTCKG